MSDLFPCAPSDLPFLTEAQMREVDRTMIEDFGISLLQMMENAGRNLATVVHKRFLDGEPVGKRVVVLAGPGGNGGGGLAGARHLANVGASVRVILATQREKFTDAAAAQLKTLERSGSSVAEFVGDALPNADVLIDAVFGYSMRDDPREPAASLIRAANSHGAPVVSNDIPSGIESTSGRIGEPAIIAAATVTLALPKIGLGTEQAKRHAGELYLGDIAVPPELYTASFPEFGPVRPFVAGPIVRIW